MVDPDDPEVIAVRERAERVMARRAKAKERGEATPAAEQDESKSKNGGRAWYKWAFDLALFALAAYMIKTRFFDKPAQPTANAEAPRSSTSTPARAATSVFTQASAAVLERPEASAAVVESLAPHTGVEVLELSAAGFMRVRTPSGKTGWLPATTVHVAP